MKITVEVQRSLRPNLPNVLASFSVTLECEGGPITIHDGRILQSKAGAVWVSLPTFSLNHGGRQFEYKPTVEVPASLGQAINTEALRSFDAWKGGQ